MSTSTIRLARSNNFRWLLPALGGCGAALIAAGLGVSAAEPQWLRVGLVVVLGLLVLSVGITAPRALLPGLIIWLTALGMVRRMVSEASVSGKIDWLLLIGPLGVVLLVWDAGRRGAFRNRTGLSLSVALLSIGIIAAAFNPLQPSKTAGIASLLLVLVPVGAFWIGRASSDRAITRLIQLVGVLAVPAGLYGLIQTFVGFPSWDKLWIQTAGYTALKVAGTTRGFASFSSASEYATFIVVGLLIWLIFWTRRAMLPIALGMVGLLGVAILYASARGVVVLAIVSLALIAAAKLRLPVIASGVIVVIAVVGLVVLARHASGPPAPVATSPAQLTPSASALVNHELSGLADPLSSNTSTLGVHFQELTSGLSAAIHNPIGQGLSAITIAGGKFGDATSQNTEVDPSNMAVALGMPGLILYLFVLILGLSEAYRIASARRDVLSYACLAILGVTLLQWLNGGQYAVAILPWIALGWIDRRGQERRRERSAEQTEAEPVLPPVTPAASARAVESTSRGRTRPEPRRPSLN